MLGMLGMLGCLAQLSLMMGQQPEPVGSGHLQIVPYGSFPTSDGSIVIACPMPQFWINLARAIGRADLPDDTRFQTMPLRRDGREALDAIIAGVTATRATAEWEAIFARADIPCVPVLGVGAALTQPHAVAREMLVTVDHPTLGTLPIVGRPVKLPGAEQAPLRPPPLLGEHTLQTPRDDLG